MKPVMKRYLLPILVALVLLCAGPTFGEVGMIVNGIDTWTTPADGSTFVDFSNTPIPAGFFCPGSAPFTGRILWQGVPIVSKPSNALGNADTIVQRLDNAIFDKMGHTSTRLQVRALSLESIQPIETECGNFNVTASLNGLQPMTTMQIVRENDDSGHFVAVLGLNVRMTFTPVSTGAIGSSIPSALVFDHSVELETGRAQWASELPAGNQGGQVGGFVLADTDGDAVADTYLPGQSAFHPIGSTVTEDIPTSGCWPVPIGAICHEASGGHCHCAYP